MHRKFRRLTRTLGAAYVARGVLEVLWDACYEAGDDYLGTAEDIKERVGWAGDAGELAAALVECGQPEGDGFLELVVVNDIPAYRVHDLWHHAPDYVTRRRERELERQALKVCEVCGTEYRASDPRSKHCSPACRTRRWRESQAARDGHVTDSDKGVRHSDAGVTERDTTPSPSPAPAPTRSPRGKSGSSESQPALPAAEPRRRHDERPVATGAVLTFPTVGKGPSTWALTEAQLSEWQECYPGIAVLAEAQQALAWVKANPGRRKTAKGMPRFLVSWLSRSQNSRGGRGMTTPATARGRGPDMQATLAWKDECARLHGGRCSNAIFHAAVMAEERAS